MGSKLLKLYTICTTAEDSAGYYVCF